MRCFIEEDAQNASFVFCLTALTVLKGFQPPFNLPADMEAAEFVFPTKTF